MGVVVGMYSQNIYILQSYTYDLVFDGRTKVVDTHGCYCLYAQNAQK